MISVSDTRNILLGLPFILSLNLASFHPVLEKIKGFDLNLRASLAIKTIDNFVASHDREIELAHVPQNNDVRGVTTVTL